MESQELNESQEQVKSLSDSNRKLRLIVAKYQQDLADRDLRIADLAADLQIATDSAE